MIGSAIAVAMLLAAWIGAAIALERRGHRPEVEGTFDALVVPGAAVRRDGRPSGALARRTEHAAALWLRGVAPRIVFTGGATEGGPSEASVAAAHAEALGIPPEARLLEETSASTEENALGASRLLGACSVLIVTDSYHSLRCRRVFGRRFPSVEVATTRPAPGFTALRLAAREVLVLLVYAVRGRLSSAPPADP